MKKILHADDVQRFRDLVREEFDSDFEVVSLIDCDGVLAAAANEGPDVVILDHLMPSSDDESGFEICQKLREEYPSLPIIVFTGAWEDQRDVSEVEEIWKTRVVFKSQGTEALRAAVEQVLG